MLPLALQDCDNQYDKLWDIIHRAPNSCQLFFRILNSSALQLPCSYTRDNTYINIYKRSKINSYPRRKLDNFRNNREKNLPIPIRNVFHFWTEAVSMIAAITAVAKQ